MHVEKLVLRHPERIPAAVIYADLLALSGNHLLSWIRAEDASAVMPVILFWGIVCLMVLACLVRALAGIMAACKVGGELIISVSFGPIPLWRVRSVLLADLAKVAVSERVRRVRRGKIHCYTILYEYAGAQTELLGDLSRENAELLVEFCGFAASHVTVQQAD